MTTTTNRAPTVATTQPPPRRSGVKSFLLVIGVLVLLMGALALLGLLMRTSESETLRFDEAVTAVEIEADAGAVEIVGSATGASEVVVTREWWLGDRPAVDAEVVDGTLQLQGDCANGWLFWTCATSFVASVPSGVSVTVRTDAGSIEVRDIDNGADLVTSAGSIEVSGVSGTVVLRTSAGSVDAEVASSDVDAVSSAGAVRITDTVAPDRLVARSSAGSVEVTVPDEVYRVEASTSAGNETVEVDTSVDAPRLISVTSSAGNVAVRRGGAR